MIKALINKLDQIDERRRASYYGRGFFEDRKAQTLEALSEYEGREVFFIRWGGLPTPPKVVAYKVERVYMTAAGYVRIKVSGWSAFRPGEFAQRFYPTELDAERDLLRKAQHAAEKKHDELKQTRHRIRMIKQRQKRRGLPWT